MVYTIMYIKKNVNILYIIMQMKGCINHVYPNVYSKVMKIKYIITYLEKNCINTVYYNVYKRVV